jgi:ATP-dependent protease ClpP protease subunit
MIFREAKEFNFKALQAFNESGLPRTFKAAATSTGYEIQMYDIIGSEETNSSTFAAALTEAGGGPVTIRLSSPGGSVFDGWTIYNQLRAYDGDTTVIVDGVAASIASCIALGAKTVLTSDTSMWMVHNAWKLTVGNASELRAEADVLDKIDENLAAIYAAKSGREPADWAAMMQAETWFTSAEAIKAGLADRISDAGPKKESRKALIDEMAIGILTVKDTRANLDIYTSDVIDQQTPENAVDTHARELRVRRAKAVQYN